VDIAELHGCHFTGAESQLGQEQQNGMVSQTRGGLQIATLDKLTDLFPGEVLRQLCVTVPRRREHGRCKLPAEPVYMEEAKERAEPADHQLNGANA
jgi:hypothetical protein